MTMTTFSVQNERLQKQYVLNTLQLRAFGSRPEDLHADFGSGQRPQLITQVLQACMTQSTGEPIPEAFFWEMTLSSRVQALWSLVFFCDSQARFVPIRCPFPDCAQAGEIEIHAGDIEQLAAGQEHDTLRIALPERTLTLRRARGLDQQVWQTERFQSEQEAWQRMVWQLISDADKTQWPKGITLATAEVERINQAMGEFEPLLHFQVQSACPYCGQASLHGIDLEMLALQALQGMQHRLLMQVHALALHYHWSEQEICAIPEWRRKKYLSWLEQRA